MRRLLLALAFAGILCANQPAPPEIRAIAEEAYVFAYPLVVMDLTRQDALQAAPTNFFLHAPAFPDDHFRGVIRPNADTLYSTAWLDLSKEPILLRVPDTHGRYYMMQILDAWTETVSVPGKRTTGTGEGWFAITGPRWEGKLPQGVRRIASPTNTVWLLGRTQTNTAADYPAVHAIQQQYLLMPLSRYPDGVKRPPAAASPPARRLPPPARAAAMSAAEFFRAFADLLAQNPPHAEDGPMMARLARIGIVPGRPFQPEALGEAGLQALAEGVRAAARELTPNGGKATVRNGWRELEGRVGRYGSDYRSRAEIARAGLGANPPEDAVYIAAASDGAGSPLDGSHQYRLHFAKASLPPVRAFWSLTLYDQSGYFAANAIGRHAIGDRDALTFQPDGSLDLLIQAEPPPSTTNWLPAPAGRFDLMLRLYWPEEAVLAGRWTPPAVLRQ